jgi:hypothetical protein
MGYNAIYLDRPTLSERDDGALYVAWEQFDSSNVEPATNRLRAGIWVTAGFNNGAYWGPGRQVIERNTSSHRFPCIADRLLSAEPEMDTVCVLYLRDSVAGFFPMGEGPATMNPVICQFVPSAIYGIAERDYPSAHSSLPQASVVRGVLCLGVNSRQNAGCRADLLDAAGRRVVGLHAGANDVRALAPGVYFVRPASGVRRQASGVTKVVLIE